MAAGACRPRAVWLSDWQVLFPRVRWVGSGDAGFCMSKQAVMTNLRAVCAVCGFWRKLLALCLHLCDTLRAAMPAEKARSLPPGTHTPATAWVALHTLVVAGVPAIVMMVLRAKCADGIVAAAKVGRSVVEVGRL